LQRNLFLTLICFACLTCGLPAVLDAQTPLPIVLDGKSHKFELKNKQFLSDDQPTLLVAGEVHFGRRVPLLAHPAMPCVVR
jgi:hypothetical protein